MKLTNNSGLPEPILKAIMNDDYNRGDSDFTVSELISPPRQSALKLKYKDDLEEDVEDLVFALLGKAVHKILENANELDIVEKRFFINVNGYKISSQLDNLSLAKSVLSDYKCTGAYGFYEGIKTKPEWIAQLNVQLECLRQNGFDANTLQIVGILRDWKVTEYKVDLLKPKPVYPESPIKIRPIEMWSRENTIKWIENRLEVHLKAREVLPKCTDEEIWKRYNKKLKRDIKYRCEHYCIVSNFCEQFSGERK